jgi:hypothetical protein
VERWSCEKVLDLGVEEFETGFRHEVLDFYTADNSVNMTLGNNCEWNFSAVNAGDNEGKSWLLGRMVEGHSVLLKRAQ